MKKFCWVIVGLFLFSFLRTDSAFAVAKKKISEHKVPISKQVDLEAEYYKRAEVQLDKQLYRVYRIAERIIRANKLDDYPWVFEIPNGKEYVVNAGTDQANLIVLEIGIINSFYDDVSALASTIGHEMAHQLQRHDYKKSRYNQILQKNMKQEIENSSVNTDNSNLLGAVINAGTNYYYKNKIDQEKSRLYEIAEQNAADQLAYSRSCEYEADKLGLILITRAGFDPKGYIREFELFKRMRAPLEEDSTHPADENRLYQIQTSLKSMDTAKLKKEGLYNIKRSKPLGYEKSYYKENNSLRKKTIVISSKFATEEVNDPFKKMFGK